MQIKTIVRHHLTPVSMAIIKKTREKCSQGMEKVNPCALFGWSYIGTATMESMEVPQKIKNRTTIWSNNSTAGYISEGKQITMLKTCLYPHVHCGIIYIAKTWKYPKCPSKDKWIKKVWYIHTTEFYSATKKEGNSAICNNMDGPCGHYAKWNKSYREREILMISLICGIFFLKKPHRKIDQICGYQRWGLGLGKLDEGGWKVQTSSYKINNYLECSVQHNDYS